MPGRLPIIFLSLMLLFGLLHAGQHNVSELQTDIDSVYIQDCQDCSLKQLTSLPPATTIVFQPAHISLIRRVGQIQHIQSPIPFSTYLGRAPPIA